MYRGLAEEQPQQGEEDYAFQFECAALHHPGPALRAEQALRGRRLRADPAPRGQVPEGPLREDAPEREERAELVRAADEALVDVGGPAQEARDQPPYVKNYVLARTTPLTRARKTLPSFDQTFWKLVAQHRGLRRRQGPLRGHPARGHDGGGSADRTPSHGRRASGTHSRERAGCWGWTAPPHFR